MSTTDTPSSVSCAACEACCCRLEVILMGDDDVPARFTAEDRWGGQVMRRLEDGWCAALDRNTMKCTIYERRPMICAEYQMGGDDCIEERSLFSAQRPAVGLATPTDPPQKPPTSIFLRRITRTIK